MQLLKKKKKKKKKKKLTSKQQPGIGSGDGELYVGSDPSHEWMHWGIIYWTQIRPEIWKYLEKQQQKTPLHHHEQCLGMNTVENQ